MGYDQSVQKLTETDGHTNQGGCKAESNPDNININTIYAIISRISFEQEDIMAEARQVEADAATYLDQISRYFITRGKIISKIAKYPHVVSFGETKCQLSQFVCYLITWTFHTIYSQYIFSCYWTSSVMNDT